MMDRRVRRATMGRAVLELGIFYSTYIEAIVAWGLGGSVHIPGIPG